MITVKLLKNHPESITKCAEIWHEVLGKIWVPEVTMEKVVQRFGEHLNEDTLPITFVAFDADKPIGMCSLRENDGIRPDIKPWLGSLVVDPKYQKQGIGKMLIDVVRNKAQKLGFSKLYLFAFDPSLPDYYARLGWAVVGTEEFKGHPIIVMEASL